MVASPVVLSSVAAVIASVCLAAPAHGSEPADSTKRAWHLYVDFTEARHAQEREVGSFLEAEEPAVRTDCERALGKGEVCIWKRETLTEEGKTVPVPDGMIHHWAAAVMVPGASLDRVLQFVQAYDDSAQFYAEVQESRLTRQDDEETFDIFLRLKRKKVITIHYNTEHRVVYRRHGERRASSKSIATRIREVANAGRANEAERETNEDRGFLWALRSYWWFVETHEGTRVECESISLSRSIPAAARWLVQNYVDSVPRESLLATLEPMRDHLSESASHRPR